jgi:hypothetical protein
MDARLNAVRASKRGISPDEFPGRGSGVLDMMCSSGMLFYTSRAMPDDNDSIDAGQKV